MIRIDNIRIREFRLSDLVPVQRLIHDTIDTCYFGVYPDRAVQFFKKFHSEKRIAERHQKGEILIAEREGIMVATGTIVSNEVLGVFVDARYQGCGYGKAMMRELEYRIKARGLTEVVLSISLPSKGFYESLGYEVLHACSLDVGEGQYLEYWEARKTLKEKVS